MPGTAVSLMTYLKNKETTSAGNGGMIKPGSGTFWPAFTAEYFICSTGETPSSGFSMSDASSGYSSYSAFMVWRLPPFMTYTAEPSSVVIST